MFELTQVDLKFEFILVDQDEIWCVDKAVMRSCCKSSSDLHNKRQEEVTTGIDLVACPF